MSHRLVCLAVLVAVAVAGAGVFAPPAEAQAAVKPAALTLWKQAMDFHRAKDPARALEIFLKAYAADPAVLSLPAEGLLDAGILHLRTQLATKKDDVQYTYRLAELYNLRGDLGEAIKAYRRVAQIAPNSPLAQVASDEARKLEGFQGSNVASASPSPSPTASPDPAKAGYEEYATGKKDKNDPKAAEAEAKVKELEESLKKQKEETEQVRAELERLREEHAKVIEDLRKAQYMPFGWAGSRVKEWTKEEKK